MAFIEPMYASPFPKKGLNLGPGTHVVERKYDGHRLIVQVGPSTPSMIPVIAWSRNGLVRHLPAHLVKDLQRWPSGIYDGELFVPGQRSYGVTEIVNGPDLVLVIFDILELCGKSVMGGAYVYRRNFLVEISKQGKTTDKVDIAPSMAVRSMEEVKNTFKQILSEGGEGLILKNIELPYEPGKRPKTSWIKFKDLQSAVLSVVGFIPSKGKINDRGNFATVVLKDEEGNYTTVKTRNDEECRKFEAAVTKGWMAWREIKLENGKKMRFHVGTEREGEFSLGSQPPINHPSIGRKLRIEFQERTSNEFMRAHPELDLSSYRHPRWDRWEDE